MSVKFMKILFEKETLGNIIPPVTCQAFMHINLHQMQKILQLNFQKELTIFASADGGPRSRVCAPSTLVEIFRHTCLQSHLQTFPPTSSCCRLSSEFAYGSLRDELSLFQPQF